MEPPEMQNLRRRLQTKLACGEIDKQTYDRMMFGLANVGDRADKLSGGVGLAMADPFPSVKSADSADEYGVASSDGISPKNTARPAESPPAARSSGKPTELPTSSKEASPQKPAPIAHPMPPIAPARNRPNWQARRMRRLAITFVIFFVLPLGGLGASLLSHSGQGLSNWFSYRGIMSFISQSGHSVPVFKSVGVSQEDIQSHFDKANACRDRAAFDEAIQEYTKTIELDPKHQEAFFWRGYVRFQQGEPEESVKDYTEAIRLNPNNPHAFNNRGYSYQAKGDYASAAKDYTQAVKLDPQFALGWCNRGVIRHALGQLDEAIADYTEAVRLNPRCSSAFNNRGLLYLAKGKRQDAIADFDYATQLKPDNPMYLVNRAQARFDNKEYDKARIDVASALRLQPNDAAALKLQSAIAKTQTAAKPSENKTASSR